MFYNSEQAKSEEEIVSLMPTFLKDYHFEILKQQKFSEEFKSGRLSTKISDLESKVEFLSKKLEEMSETKSSDVKESTSAPSTSSAGPSSEQYIFGARASDPESEIKRRRGAF